MAKKWCGGTGMFWWKGCLLGCLTTSGVFLLHLTSRTQGHHFFHVPFFFEGTLAAVLQSLAPKPRRVSTTKSLHVCFLNCAFVLNCPLEAFVPPSKFFVIIRLWNKKGLWEIRPPKIWWTSHQMLHIRVRLGILRRFIAFNFRGKLGHIFQLWWYLWW